MWTSVNFDIGNIDYPKQHLEENFKVQNARELY